MDRELPARPAPLDERSKALVVVGAGRHEIVGAESEELRARNADQLARGRVRVDDGPIVVGEEPGVERALEHGALKRQTPAQLLLRCLQQDGRRSVGSRDGVERLPGVGELPSELVVLALERIEVTHADLPPVRPRRGIALRPA